MTSRGGRGLMHTASHGAIIARELGVPCVIKPVTGTQDLRTGDRIRVDGDEGTVEVLERAPRIQQHHNA